MKSLLFLVPCVAILYNSVAYADQCAYVTKEQAASFAKLVTIGETLYHLCEPCGDSTETNSEKKIEVTSVGYRAAGYMDYYEVVINGQAVDLAYIYKETARLDKKNKVLVNAALLVACQTSGVTSHYVSW
jgi:hypothetical protein